MGADGKNKMRLRLKELPYEFYIGLILGVIAVLAGMIFLHFGNSAAEEPVASPEEITASLPSLWWLLMLILPVGVFLGAASYFPNNFRKLREDVNARWKLNYREKKTARNNLPGRISRGFRSLFRMEFGISVLSTPKNIIWGFLGNFILVIWSAGWVLYTIAIWADTGHFHSVTETLLYAAMSSFDLFLFDINGNVIDNIMLPEMWTGILTGLLSIVSVLASCALCSIIIGMFLTRFLTWLKVKTISISDKKNNHLYIIFNQNETSEILAQNILKGDPDRALVIFIHTSETDEEDDDGWSNMVRLFAAKNRLNSRLDGRYNVIRLHALRTLEEAFSLWEEDALNLDEPRRYGSIWDALGIPEVADLIGQLPMNGMTSESSSCGDKDKAQVENATCDQINVFFLSENRDENVLNAKIMAQYFKERKDLEYVFKKVFCSSRKDSVTSVVEDRYISQETRMRISILDDSRLAVRELIDTPAYHPVNFVEIDAKDNPGTVSSKFTSLIVGFGETGRDAFRFLYEFGAFVDAERKWSEAGVISARSPFECHIVDPDINDLKAPFTANSPSIFKDKIPGDDNSIHFHAIKDTSEEFYSMLDRIAAHLNYVVVATGDDERNITIATRILDYVRRKRATNNLRHFKIFVRTYHRDSFSHLEGIVDYTKEMFKEISDEIGASPEYIVIFGKRENIYGFNSIIEDRELYEAGLYHDKYQEIVESNEAKRELWDKLWKMLDYQFYIANVKKEKRLKRPEALLDTKRKIDESRKNSLHAPTKLHILSYVWRTHKGLPSLSRIDFNALEKAMALMEGFKGEFAGHFNDLEDKVSNLQVSSDESDSSGLDNMLMYRLLYNLCKLEHIRWNASHQLRGFVKGPDKNFIAKTHEDLTVWERLDAETKRYDYPVVKTSVKIWLEANCQAETNENKRPVADRNQEDSGSSNI